MRFVLNALPLRTGGGLTVGLEIIRRLPEVAPKDVFYVLASPDVGYEELEAENVVINYANWSAMGSLAQLRFLSTEVPRLVHECGAHALFNMANLASLRTGVPQLVLFHLPHMIYPETIERIYSSLGERVRFSLKRYYFNLGIRRSYIAAQTAVARNRLIEQYGVHPERTYVVPNAVFISSGDAPPGSQAIAMSRLSQPLRCFYLTRYYPHKNLEVLPRVAKRLQQLGESNVVFITTLSPEEPEVQTFLAEAERICPGSIVNIGHVPFDQIGPCFRESWALVMPTLLESFSGTYLEAMNSGRPILTSERDFARDVCGDAAIYFDPLDPDDIARSILRLRDEPNLRENLIERGKARLAHRSPGWYEITQNYVTILRTIAQEASG